MMEVIQAIVCLVAMASLGICYWCWLRLSEHRKKFSDAKRRAEIRWERYRAVQEELRRVAEELGETIGFAAAQLVLRRMSHLRLEFEREGVPEGFRRALRDTSGTIEQGLAKQDGPLFPGM